MLVVVGIAVFVVLANSDLLLITNVVIDGGENVDQETLEQLVDVPEGSTLLNVDEDAIEESLERSPWIVGVTIERELPDTLHITVEERDVLLLVYMSTDDVAWAVSDDGVWITPVSLAAVDDAGTTDDSTEGDEGDSTDGYDDGTDGDSTDDEYYTEDESTDESVDDADDTEESEEESEGEAAALSVAESYGALLVTDVPTSVEPVSGEAVDSEEVLAVIAYAQGFSEEFLAEIKSISAASVEGLSANLENGVEVALGDAEDIATKEKVVTKLLEEEEGVTYINVREADAYTFRATPSE